MPFLCYKCHKMIYNGSPEFHNIFCKRPFRKNFYHNINNNRNYHYNYNNDYRHNNYNRNNYYSRQSYYNPRNNQYRYYDNSNHGGRSNSHYFSINNNNRNNSRNNRIDNNRRVSRINILLDLIRNEDLDLNFLLNIQNNNNNNIRNNNNNNNERNNHNNDNNNLSFDNIENESNFDFEESEYSIESNGIDEDMFNRFPKTIIDDIDKLKEKKCIICLENFKNGDESTTVPCFHIFHPNCIGEWLKKHNTCPICKTEFKEEI